MKKIVSGVTFFEEKQFGVNYHPGIADPKAKAKALCLNTKLLFYPKKDEVRLYISSYRVDEEVCLLFREEQVCNVDREFICSKQKNAR